MQIKFFETKEKHTFHLVDPSQLPFWISCTMRFFHSIVSRVSRFMWLRSAQNQTLKNIIAYNASTIVLAKDDKAPIGLLDAIYKFLSIWTFEQWFWSLLGLILLYIVSTRLHNKYIAPRIGLYINNQMTAYLISFDLLINFNLGIYFMFDRFSDFGQFMVQCPVAVSPFIFLAEIIVMTIIFLVRERAKKSAAKPKDK